MTVNSKQLNYWPFKSR